MPSVSTSRDVVCASHYSSKSNGWPLSVTFFMNTRDVKYIKYERKGGDKKKVGLELKDLLWPEGIYPKREDISCKYQIPVPHFFPQIF